MNHLIEEVAAGRTDALANASTEQLQQVLEGLQKKRKRDEDYIKKDEKKQKNCNPQPPDIVGRRIAIAPGVTLQNQLLERMRLEISSLEDRDVVCR